MRNDIYLLFSNKMFLKVFRSVFVGVSDWPHKCLRLPTLRTKQDTSVNFLRSQIFSKELKVGTYYYYGWSRHIVSTMRQCQQLLL